MIVRVFLDIIIYFIAILIPGWSFFILGTIASYLFDNFFELILVSLLVDAIYGFPIPGWYGFRFVFTALAVIVFVSMNIFKEKVRAF